MPPFGRPLHQGFCAFFVEPRRADLGVVKSGRKASFRRKTRDRMELFETVGNVMPPGAIVSGVRTRDGLRLRVARWPASGGSRGTVAVAIGRSEFIEQYYEVVAALRARSFDVVVWDWRGQGQSDRETRHVQRGYVSSFAAYRRDLVAIEAQVLRAFAPRPWFGLGHSMGGALLIDQAHDGTSPFERLVLSAPMIDLPLRPQGRHPGRHARHGFDRPRHTTRSWRQRSARPSPEPSPTTS